MDATYQTEEIFDFFRNVLNILPTHKQKNIIRIINNGGNYLANGRQEGLTTVINGYVIWLLHMARVRKEKITIVMYNKKFIEVLFNRDKIKEINSYSKNELNLNCKNNYDLISEYGEIIFANNLTNLRGINIDYLFSESEMDTIINAKKIMYINQAMGVI